MAAIYFPAADLIKTQQTAMPDFPTFSGFAFADFTAKWRPFLILLFNINIYKATDIAIENPLLALFVSKLELAASKVVVLVDKDELIGVKLPLISVAS